MRAKCGDNGVMCVITGITAISTVLATSLDISTCMPDELLSLSFAQLPFGGSKMLAISVFAFAAATLIGWSLIGEKALRYLVDMRGAKNAEKKVTAYKVGYLVIIFTGAIMSLNLIWECADFTNALMAIPNIIMLFALRKDVT